MRLRSKLTDRKRYGVWADLVGEKSASTSGMMRRSNAARGLTTGEETQGRLLPFRSGNEFNTLPSKR